MWIRTDGKIRCNIFVFAASILFLLLNCTSEGDFLIAVHSLKGQPVAGANVSGGIDWDYFTAETNINGIASLPGYARGQTATIRKTNFYPTVVEHLEPGLYWVEPTPQRLKLIGEVEGDAIRFDSEHIATITYDGNYHVYAYDAHGISEIAGSQLPGCVRFFKIFGDTLWLSTHGEGFYVYSLSNLLQPQQICHLDIPGYTMRPFAVRGTILAVAETEGPLRLFSFSYDGSYQELEELGDYWVEDVTFMSHYLIIVGAETANRKCFPVVYDVQDPTNPQCVYTGSQPEFLSCFLYGSYLVMQPYVQTPGPIEYRLLDLSNPPCPQVQGPYTSDGYFDGIVNDSIAVGLSMMAVLLKGNIFMNFSTVATATQGGFAGGFPPYYIIGYNLWKLEQ